jgi:hypothetical protein
VTVCLCDKGNSVSAESVIFQNRLTRRLKASAPCPSSPAMPLLTRRSAPNLTRCPRFKILNIHFGFSLHKVEPSRIGSPCRSAIRFGGWLTGDRAWKARGTLFQALSCYSRLFDFGVLIWAYVRLSFILNSWLPDRSGVELCGANREFDRHTSILFCSAAAFPHEIQEGIRAGDQVYLTTLTTSNELRQAVVKLLSSTLKLERLVSSEPPAARARSAGTIVRQPPDLANSSQGQLRFQVISLPGLRWYQLLADPLHLPDHAGKQPNNPSVQ